jgi:hypothetical protein
MFRKSMMVALLLIALTGCLNDSRADALAALQHAAPAWLRAAPVSGDIPEREWPPEVLAFDPKRVYARPEGIYIVTATRFATEEGLFLARAAGAHATRGSDPQYTPIASGLFAYRIAG